MLLGSLSNPGRVEFDCLLELRLAAILTHATIRQSSRPMDRIAVKAIFNGWLYSLEVWREIKIIVREQALMTNVPDLAPATMSNAELLAPDLLNAQQNWILIFLKRLRDQCRAEHSNRSTGSDSDHLAKEPEWHWQRRQKSALYYKYPADHTAIQSAQLRISQPSVCRHRSGKQLGRYACALLRTLTTVQKHSLRPD